MAPALASPNTLMMMIAAPFPVTCSLHCHHKHSSFGRYFAACV